MATRGVTVRAILGKAEAFGLPLELLSGGDGLDSQVLSPHIQKTGLALAGFHEYLQPGRVLLFGESEIRYLEALASDARSETLRTAFSCNIPALVLTGGFTPPPEILVESERAAVPVFQARLATPTAFAKLTAVLDDLLAARTTVHGVLMDILGLGVLMIGESGIGKSECALDLVVRGHRLVADDTVEIRRRAETVLIGSCPDLTRNHMEIRGLGVINIRDLFGVASIRSSKRVELVVQLERWEDGREYERLGIDDAYYEILGLKVPLVRMPVAPGRNVSIVVEVAARNQLLRARGFNAARKLAARLDREIRRNGGAEEGEGERDAEGAETEGSS